MVLWPTYKETNCIGIFDADGVFPKSCTFWFALAKEKRISLCYRVLFLMLLKRCKNISADIATKFFSQIHADKSRRTPTTSEDNVEALADMVGSQP